MLKLYWNDTDWVIAESPEEAVELWLTFCGYKDADREQCRDEAGEFEEWAKPTIKWQDDEDEPHYEITVADLIAKLGKGYAGSTEG